MSRIRLLDKEFEVYLDARTIQQRVQELAIQISADYMGTRPLFLSILNGSFLFTADLVRHLTIDPEISFIKLASYKGMRSTGRYTTAIGLDVDLLGRDVILLEDIVDTGNTLFQFLPHLQQQQPRSVRIATLLHKPEATQHPLTLDYLGFSIPNKFVVGYGLDYDGWGRQYDSIYQLVTE
ncbi:MAG: hypoxanthine phosphoribosyltransferase [Bacteroidetes bacterium]|nr:hypoxanthine phosphoribosyltransferase [Bacteroidota bacterium]